MLSERRIMISTHIEKAAGSTVVDFLNTIFGPDGVLQYNPISDTLVRGSDIRISRTNRRIDALQRLVNDSPMRPFITKIYRLLSSGLLRSRHMYDTSEIPPRTRAIHGHFLSDRFDEVIEKPMRMIVIRDPYERMYSHYINWLRSHGNSEWRVQIPFDAKFPLSFEEFAMLPELRNYQTQALAGKNLSEFDFVGTTEDLDAFLIGVYSRLVKEGIIGEGETPTVGIFNTTSSKPSHVASPEFLQIFRDAHAKDFELYEQARIRSRSSVEQGFSLSHQSIA